MKDRIVVTSMVLALVVSCGTVYAQDDTGRPAQTQEREMSKDEWQQEMNTAIAKRAVLEQQVDSLTQILAALNMKDSSLAAQINQQDARLAAKVNTINNDRVRLERRLNDIDNTLNYLAALEDSMLPKHSAELDKTQSSIDEVKKNPLSRKKVYGDRIRNEERRLTDMRPLIAQVLQEGHTYTVGTWSSDKACLWNIAAKSSVYGDPALWVKIWQANTRTIENPDLIQPGQRLHIPAKSELTKNELSAMRHYYSSREGSRQYASSISN